MPRSIIATVLVAGMLTVTTAFAGDWSPQQQQIVDAIAHLSATTAPDGGGPDAYAACLAPEFTRWSMGSNTVEDRDALVSGVRGWWMDGWRVIGRENDFREITVHDDFATVRRIVSETYRGPEGDESGSRTAIAETWVRRDGEWLLLHVNTRQMEP